MPGTLRRQPELIWEGHFLDGRSAVRQDVRVEVTAGGLIVSGLPGGEEIVWAYDAVRQTQGFHVGEVVRFEHNESGEALVVPDPAILSAIHALAGGFSHRFHNPRMRRWFWPGVLASSLALAALIGAGVIWGLPAVTAAAADHVPVPWEEALGKEVVSELAPEADRCTDKVRQQAVEAIVAKLVGRGSRYRYTVTVSKKDVINAFAAPGGYIVVFDGLLRLTRTPDELAGVLAHEIEHVERRHGTRALLRELSLRALIGVMVGDAKALETALNLAGHAAGLSYRREDEAAADSAGMARVQAAKADPRGMISFFKVLEKEGAAVPKEFEFLSDHPHTADRIAALERMAARAAYKPEPLLAGRSWEDVKRLCR